MQLKHRPLRQQYSRIIDKAPGFRCSGAWPDAESALANLPGNLTDVVLMDINLPGMSGVECVARLKQLLPGVNIIMFTVYDDSDLIFRALENGASGFLLKRTAPVDLLRSIEEVNTGGAPMTSHVARLVVQSFGRHKS